MTFTAFVIGWATGVACGVVLAASSFMAGMTARKKSDLRRKKEEIERKARSTL